MRRCCRWLWRLHGCLPVTATASCRGGIGGWRVIELLLVSTGIGIDGRTPPFQPRERRSKRHVVVHRCVFQRLQQLFPGNPPCGFRVQVLSQLQTVPRLDETQALAMQPREMAVIRQVLLLCGTALGLCTHSDTGIIIAW